MDDGWCWLVEYLLVTILLSFIRQRPECLSGTRPISLIISTVLFQFTHLFILKLPRTDASYHYLQWSGLYTSSIGFHDGVERYKHCSVMLYIKQCIRSDSELSLISIAWDA